MMQYQGTEYRGTLSFVFFNGWRSRQLDNRLFGAYRNDDPIHDWLARCDMGLGKTIQAFTSYARIGDDLFLYDTGLIVFAELLNRRRTRHDPVFWNETTNTYWLVRNDTLDTLIPIVKRYIRRYGVIHEL